MMKLKIPLLLVFFSIPLLIHAQQAAVKGKVTDKSDGQPIPGVTVSVKGTNVKTVSNTDGTYSIFISPVKDTLLFTSMSYEKFEVKVSGRKTVDVSLSDAVSVLSEVVVVGYGKQLRSDLTGAISSVKMADFEKAPVKSFDDALAGRVAGVQVSGNDGQPGAVNNIVIRGGNSVTQDNSPLYVVDGFPLEDANSNAINPADIESMDILKDASATAIYGARGANGVIIITTKKGKEGAPVIRYNGYLGQQSYTKKVDLMDPYEFVKYQIELNPTLFKAAYLPGDRTPDYYKTAKGVDFQDDVFRNALMQNHELALRGGNKTTKYSISGNIINQDGIIINSDFMRRQGRISLDQTINNKLKVGLNLNYSNTINSGAIVASTFGSASANILYAIWGYRPVTGNENDDLGNELYDPSIDLDNTSDYRINPVLSLKNELRRKINNSMLANAYAEYQFTSNLKLRVTGGVSTTMVKDEIFNNSKTQAGNPVKVNGITGSIYYSPSNSWLNENTLTYDNVFNKSHHLTVLGGFTMQSGNTGRFGYYASHIPNESLGLDGLDESVELSGVSSSSRNGLVSFLGRINYSYKSKYLLTVSYRDDGSSKFTASNRWSHFPSGSLAWRMSRETFMKQLKFVTDAKVRLSYGVTGNNRVGDFPYLTQLSFPDNFAYSYNNGIPSLGVGRSAFGNPDLKWESTTQMNMGYDLSLFKERISLTVDWYRKTTKDLLLNANLPFSTGMAKGFKNVGSMRNQGLEFSLNTININAKDFTWSTSFNISFNKNKLLSLTENEDYMSTSVSWDSNWNNLSPYIAIVGQPVAQMYGLIWDGVYQYSDFDKSPSGQYTLKSTVATNGSGADQPGDIKYKDINGDLKINARDYTVIGRALPIHTGGLSNNLNYRGFELNVFFQWSYGNDLINANRLVFEGNGRKSLYLNQFASYEDRWTPDNQSNTLFRTLGQGPANYSSRVIEDGSFIRLKTVSFSYAINADFIKRAKIKSLKVYTSAQNLFTWTKYSGPDPEVSARNSALTPGFDFSAYPYPRTITLGLNLSL